MSSDEDVSLCSECKYCFNTTTTPLGVMVPNEMIYWRLYLQLDWERIGSSVEFIH